MKRLLRILWRWVFLQGVRPLEMPEVKKELYLAYVRGYAEGKAAAMLNLHHLIDEVMGIRLREEDSGGLIRAGEIGSGYEAPRDTGA